MTDTPISQTPADVPASPSAVPPVPSKIRRTRADLQARAAASAKYRKRLKAKGVPQASEIDAMIASMFLRHLSKPNGLHLRTETLSQMGSYVVQAGAWEQGGEAALKAIEARIKKLLAKRRPNRTVDLPRPAQPAS